MSFFYIKVEAFGDAVQDSHLHAFTICTSIGNFFLVLVYSSLYFSLYTFVNVIVFFVLGDSLIYTFFSILIISYKEQQELTIYFFYNIYTLYVLSLYLTPSFYLSYYKIFKSSKYRFFVSVKCSLL